MERYPVSHLLQEEFYRGLQDGLNAAFVMRAGSGDHESVETAKSLLDHCQDADAGLHQGGDAAVMKRKGRILES